MPPTPSSRPSTATVDAFAAASPGPTMPWARSRLPVHGHRGQHASLGRARRPDGPGARASTIGSCARAVDGHRGSVIKTTGDGMLAVFADAVRCPRRGGRRPAGAARRDVGRDRRRCGSGWRSMRVPPRHATATTSVPPSIGWRGSSPSPTAADHLLHGRGRARPRWAPGVGRALSTSARTGFATSTDPSRSTRSSSADLDRDFPPLRSLSTRRSTCRSSSRASSARQGARRGGVAHRAAPARDPHRHGRDRQDPVDAGGRGPAHGPPTRTACGSRSWRRSATPPRSRPRSPRALGAPEIPGRPDGRNGHGIRSRTRTCLLLLDNAEHLVDGVARFADRLLANPLRVCTS